MTEGFQKSLLNFGFTSPFSSHFSHLDLNKYTAKATQCSGSIRDLLISRAHSIETLKAQTGPITDLDTAASDLNQTAKQKDSSITKREIKFSQWCKTKCVST